MTIEHPSPRRIPALRHLWQQAFGDSDTFLDGFFRTGFAPERCRCLVEADVPVAALYWFDAEYAGSRFAYMYAVATDPAFRGQGLCHRLMADTHNLLAQLGYAGTLLVPAGDSLRNFYAGIGYHPFSTVREFSVLAAGPAIPLRKLSAEAYATLRRQYLPRAAVIQEGSTLDFLQTYGDFYAGEHCILTAVADGSHLFVPELLGDPACAPGILQTLHAATGSFRCPGSGKSFAMALPFSGTPLPPGYFGLALD